MVDALIISAFKHFSSVLAIEELVTFVKEWELGFLVATKPLGRSVRPPVRPLS